MKSVPQAFPVHGTRIVTATEGSGRTSRIERGLRMAGYTNLGLVSYVQSGAGVAAVLAARHVDDIAGGRGLARGHEIDPGVVVVGGRGRIVFRDQQSHAMRRVRIIAGVDIGVGDTP